MVAHRRPRLPGLPGLLLVALVVMAPGHVLRAEAPPPLPLLGTEGVDATGYPTQYVDRLKLRQLLFLHRYAELNQDFEAFQQAFEVDPRKEYWPIDAGDAFETSEPDLLVDLDKWVAATPQSFAPWLARGVYWSEVAGQRRGAGWLKDTPKKNLEGMHEAETRALEDLDRAFELRPKLIAALRVELISLRHENTGELPMRIAEQAGRLCPTCFQIRTTRLWDLTPRWGGSYDAMRDYVVSIDTSLTPRLVWLAGYADMDRAEMLLLNHRAAEALPIIERACRLGDDWEFLLVRARIKLDLGELKGAKRDVDRAIASRPGVPELLYWRSFFEMSALEWEAAGRDFVAAFRVQPTNSHVADWYGDIARGLAYASGEARRRHDDAAVKRLTALEQQLRPPGLREGSGHHRH